MLSTYDRKYSASDLCLHPFVPSHPKPNRAYCTQFSGGARNLTIHSPPSTPLPHPFHASPALLEPAKRAPSLSDHLVPGCPFGSEKHRPDPLILVDT